MEVFILVTGALLIVASLSYAVLIFIFTSGWSRLMKAVPLEISEHIFKVSVVVAARDEEHTLLQLLDDLTRQDYPQSFIEVIVVDDFSSDRTAELVANYIKLHGLTGYKLIRREGEGGGSKKAALSEGVRAASGEIILTTDADCRVPAGWVPAMARHFSRTEISMVAGPVAYYGLENVADRFQAVEFLGLVASGAGAIGAGYPFMCNGSSLAYRREDFLEVKGYEGNEQFRSGDDVFLMHKIKKTFGSASIVFSLEQKALVRTTPAKGFKSFLKQRARWASKSRGYKDWMALSAALSVFLLSLVFTLIFVMGFFNPVAFLVYIALIISKTLVDFPLMRQITRFTGNKELLKWLLPFQGVYPVYVVIAAVMSIFMRRKW